jgi:hypothetical protein
VRSESRKVWRQKSSKLKDRKKDRKVRKWEVGRVGDYEVGGKK